MSNIAVSKPLVLGEDFLKDLQDIGVSRSFDTMQLELKIESATRTYCDGILFWFDLELFPESILLHGNASSAGYRDILQNCRTFSTGPFVQSDYMYLQRRQEQSLAQGSFVSCDSSNSSSNRSSSGGGGNASTFPSLDRNAIGRQSAILLEDRMSLDGSIDFLSVDVVISPKAGILCQLKSI